ncbi:centrosomal protein of 295 kDa isoform X2 [Ambystoma mexicanum]|uniref:centrosomal protein of 295 kDa isoform X2 n=1 Tax=Ambystoma mexicanum TaxID=8296 RepID=UPI0037E7BB73
MHTDKMKRKVAKVGRLRLSPNEEALLIKEEVERRRKLRLQQVRQQEKYIASQIREDVKHRRDQQLQQLAQELKAEWQEAQAQKIRALERLYHSSLKAVGEGHQHAKENVPDLNAIAKQVSVCNERAEKRHREALKELKHQRERQLKDQTWLARVRKQALYVEKERAAKIASLPPPPPEPFELIQEAKKVPAVKASDADNFSATHYHLQEPYVDREMDTEQRDARLAAEEEAERLQNLHMEVERERTERLEKAQLRGYHALKMVHLTQDRERLLEELEQMQQEDISRRRQTVAQMPPQLFVPAYRRIEIKEDWQRDLEFAFEDMYAGDKKVKGEMVLQLEPEPLPAPSVGTEDEELDISLDPNHVVQTELPGDESEALAQPVRATDGVHQPQSKLVLSKLLQRIRSQRDQRTSNGEKASVNEAVPSGSLASEERPFEIECITEQERRPDHCPAPEAMKSPEIVDTTVIAGNSLILNPQEQAARLTMAAERQRQLESLEQQKQQQLALLEELEQQRINLQENYQRTQLRMQESSRTETVLNAQQQPLVITEVPALSSSIMQQRRDAVGSPEIEISKEDEHLQIIRNYQQRLLQQNKQHQQSVDEARKRLHDYQNMLKKRYPSLSVSFVDPTASHFPVDAGPHNKEVSATENVQSGHAAFNQNVHALASCLVNISGSDRISHLPGNAACPIKPVQPFCTGQEDFEEPDQRLSSSEKSVLLGLSCTQPSCETNGSPTKSSHFEFDVLPEQRTISWPESKSSLKQIKTNMPLDHLETNQTDVVFQKCQHHPKVHVSENTEEHVFQYIPAPLRSQFVLSEPVAMLQNEEALRSRTMPIDQSTTQSPQSALQPNSLFCAEPSKQGTDSDQWTPNGTITLSDFSSAAEFRQKLLSSSMKIQAQQDQLKALQLQLDQQREGLLSKQKLQEQALLQKQNDLKSQMEQQQAVLLDFLQGKQIVQLNEETETPEDFQSNMTSSLITNFENCCEDDLRMQVGRQRLLGREHKLRPSKPPVTKIKLGPVLEQHELSAIQEIESPRSSRPSFTGVKDVSSSSSQPSFLSMVCDPNYSKSSSDTSHRDFGLSRVSTSIDRSSGESSSGSSRLSWREMLTLETASSHSSDPSKDSEVVQPVRHGVFNVDLDMGTFYRDPHVRLAEENFSQPGASTPHNLPSHSAEVSIDCVFSTTFSSGSIVTSEKMDSSPGDTGSPPNIAYLPSSLFAEASTNRILSHPVSLPLCPPRRRESTPENQECQPLAEKHRSQIQQIIDKYTKDLNESFGGNILFQAPAIGMDLSHLSNESLNRHSFHLLEPNSDLDSSTRSIHQSERTPQFQDQEEVNKPSDYSEQCDNQHILNQSPYSSIQQNSGILVSVNTNDSRLTASPMEISAIENVVHAPALELDFSHFENSEFSFPSFHPLEPKPDFGQQASYCQHSDGNQRLRDVNDLSKSSELSIKSKRNLPCKSPVSVEQDSNVLTSPLISEKEQSTVAPLVDLFGGNISLAESSKSFYQLQSEWTLGEQSPSTTASGLPSIYSGNSSSQLIQNLTDSTVGEYFSASVQEQANQLPNCEEFPSLLIGEGADQLPNAEELPNSQPLMESLRNQSTSSFQENMSFFELDLTEETVNDSVFSEKDFVTMEEGRSCFKQVAVFNTNLDQRAVWSVAIESSETTVSQEAICHSTAAVTEAGSSSQFEQDVTVQAKLVNSPEAKDPEVFLITSSLKNSVPLNSSFTCTTGTSLLQTFPLLELQAGRGIMEEPDLTLISLNDSCVTVPDLEHVRREETVDGKVDNLPCFTDDSDLKCCPWPNENEFLLPEAGNQVMTVPDSSKQDVISPPTYSLSQQFAEMHLDLTASQANLQEAFLKKKKHFIQQSTRRLEEIKMKDRPSTKCTSAAMSKKEIGQLPVQKESSSCSENSLKKITEVKVCTPEDRKKAEVQMHRRTLRLYNQLDEVKNQMTERMRQESYAKNRGKAKEFHKKTLEKLRSKIP